MTAGRAVEIVRFFRVVSPVPGMLRGAIVAVAVVGAAVVVQEPSMAARVLVPLLLLQMFASSSGFMVPARRGHYDLLLTRSSARLAVALAHWGASVTPGLVSWVSLGVAELIGRGGAGADLFVSGSCVAVAVVSMLPWAAGIALPRFGAAIGWLVVMAAATSGPGAEPGWTVVSRRTPDLVEAAVRTLVNPAVLVGVDLTRTEWLAAAPVLLLGTVSMGVAGTWVARTTVPLEAGQ